MLAIKKPVATTGIFYFMTRVEEVFKLQGFPQSEQLKNFYLLDWVERMIICLQKIDNSGFRKSEITFFFH